MHEFARLNGKKLRPVLVDYRNFERVLNVASLGNLNRQFVSLLRSEQDAAKPIVGDPAVFEKLLGSDARLVRLDDLSVRQGARRRHFPYFNMAQWALAHRGVIAPGAALGLEVLGALLWGKQSGAPLCLAPRELIDGGRWQRARRAAPYAAGAAGVALLLLIALGPLPDRRPRARSDEEEGGAQGPPSAAPVRRGSLGASVVASASQHMPQAMADAVALRRRSSVASALRRRQTSAARFDQQQDEGGGVGRPSGGAASESNGGR